ncbi:sodium:proton exchanger [Porphyrobacter algicida]|uniref:Sodium:proton exchanger n=1 Tax=Qipengyuania algicida TaxID=1836209 RepID=A0A845AJQ7_9SPHN|nr:cation:proton antiporter [Qipengyuania algicida]MXP29095.1 sodium:proton exchanger [Qipengyuania algicida]
MTEGIEPTSMLSDALVILGAAGLVIPLFARFRITPVIGFILIGVAVGPFGLGRLVPEVPWLGYVTIAHAEALEPFAEFGIVLLLFGIGLELSFKRLAAMRSLIFRMGPMELFGSAALIALGLMALGNSPPTALALGLALSLSSTALVLRIVRADTQVGRTALGTLLFEDIAIVPIIFLLGAMGRGDQTTDLHTFLTTLGTGALVVAVLILFGRTLLPYLFAQAARTKSSEIFLAASLLVVIAASLATAAVGLSPIVGALVAGLMIAETEFHGEVEGMIDPFKGLALGVFLITIGMSLNLEVLWQRTWDISVALALVLVIKAAVTSAILRLGGLRTAPAIEAGVLLASPSETTLIVLTSAVSVNLINPDAAQFWQIVTALGLTITPLLARLGRKVASRISSGDDGMIDDGDGPRVIIVGAGRVGRLVADMLVTHERSYVAVDADADLTERARRMGYLAIFGDAGRADVLRRLGVERAPAVVLTMDQPVLAERLVAKLRDEFPELLIVARARDVAHAASLYRAGASHAVPETLEASLQLSEAVLTDIGVAMGPVIASIHEKRDEFRVEIEREGALDYRPKLRTGPTGD